MWVNQDYIGSLKDQIDSLKLDIVGLRKYNSQLIDRLLIRSEVAPIMPPPAHEELNVGSIFDEVNEGNDVKNNSRQEEFDAFSQ